MKEGLWHGGGPWAVTDRSGAWSLCVVHDGLDVVAGEQAGGAVHDALVPAVVVLLDDVDDGTLLEGQLVLLITSVVVDPHHWTREMEREGEREIDR